MYSNSELTCAVVRRGDEQEGESKKRIFVQSQVFIGYVIAFIKYCWTSPAPLLVFSIQYSLYECQLFILYEKPRPLLFRHSLKTSSYINMASVLP